MANPQLKNGFVRISTELLEAYLLIARNLSPYEHAAFWLIVRKTYGFHKKMDRIPSIQYEKGIGISKGNVYRIERKLLLKNMIVVNGNTIGIQDNYELWKVK